jgi:hypothetical protein
MAANAAGNGTQGGQIARATVKPILFNTEMVDAILEGRKTATRRVIRWERDNVIKVASARGKLFGSLPEDELIPETLLCWYFDKVLPPPYQVGDVLWVRETWSLIPCIECCVAETGCERDKPDVLETADAITEGCFIYRANGEAPGYDVDRICWSPSIHMPKQAARIFLRVTEVFPNRLQEIDGAGLLEEGISRSLLFDGPVRRAFDEFQRLWDSTIRKDRLAAEEWAADPWVWVIRFERCERPDGWPE